jgi:hypothetical protein
MSFFDDYQKRMQATGTNEADAYEKATANIIEGRFKNSPSYKLAKINGIDTDIRFISGRDYKNATMHLRPNTTTNVGDMITIGAETWMVFDFINRETFPQADIQLCNEVIRWKDRDASIREYKTVAAASRYIKYDIRQNRYDVELLQGGMFIYVVQDAITSTIRASQRFIFGKQVYEISGIDDLTFVNKGVGLLQFTTRLSTIKNADDFVNKIADNSDLYLGESGGTGNTGGGPTGGDVLW